MIIPIIIITLIASAIYSGCEIAFVTANRLRLRVAAHRGNRNAVRALDLMRTPERFLTVTLVGNNVSNVTFASVAAIYLRNTFALDDGVILLLTSITVLVFGEIIPKTVFRELADMFVVWLRVVVDASHTLFYPIILLVQGATRRFLRLLGIPSAGVSDVITKEDIKLLIKERVYLPKVFEFGDIPIYKVMVPRTEIMALEISTPVAEACNQVVESGFSKLPVYKDSIDNILGVVYARDLFAHPQSLATVIREVLFTPETKQCSELLLEFREKNQSMAIAVNEFGGTSGLVTTEDILEQILGDIRDEHDHEELVMRKEDARTLLVDGRVEIAEVNKVMGLDIRSEEVGTIGGYVVHRLGRVPRPKELVHLDSRFHIEVLQASPTRVELLRMRVLP